LIHECKLLLLLDVTFLFLFFFEFSQQDGLQDWFFFNRVIKAGRRKKERERFVIPCSSTYPDILFFIIII